MEKLKGSDIEKMKRPELEKVIKDNNLDIEIKVGMSNKDIIAAIIDALSLGEFENRTRLEITTALEERSFERDQLVAMVSFYGFDVDLALNDDELAESILLLFDTKAESTEGVAESVSLEPIVLDEATMTNTASAPKAARNLKEEVKQMITDSKITASQRAYARKLCADYKVTEVFVNPTKNEYFTSECNALNSVGGDRTKIVSVKIN